MNINLSRHGKANQTPLIYLRLRLPYFSTRAPNHALSPAGSRSCEQTVAWEVLLALDAGFWAYNQPLAHSASQLCCHKVNNPGKTVFQTQGMMPNLFTDWPPAHSCSHIKSQHSAFSSQASIHNVVLQPDYRQLPKPHPLYGLVANWVICYSPGAD